MLLKLHYNNPTFRKLDFLQPTTNIGLTDIGEHCPPVEILYDNDQNFMVT